MTVAGLFVHRHRFPSRGSPVPYVGLSGSADSFIALILWSVVYLIHEDYYNTFVEHTQTVMWMSLMSAGTLLSGMMVYVMNQLIVHYKNSKTIRIYEIYAELFNMEFRLAACGSLRIKKTCCAGGVHRLSRPIRCLRTQPN